MIQRLSPKPFLIETLRSKTPRLCLRELGEPGRDALLVSVVPGENGWETATCGNFSMPGQCRDFVPPMFLPTATGVGVGFLGFSS